MSVAVRIWLIRETREAKMRAFEAMKREVVFVKPTTSIVEARRLMREFSIRHIPVVESGELSGILSDGDILLASTLREGRIDVPDRPVSSIMCMNVVTCFPNSPVKDIAATMIKLQISCIPVVIDRRILGIVTSTDLLRILSSRPDVIGMGNGSGIDLDALRSA
jgi:acetoin utilization protein AcuB